MALSPTSLSIPNNPTPPRRFSPQLVAGGQFRVVKEPLGFVKVLQWVSVVWAVGRKREVVGSGRAGME